MQRLFRDDKPLQHQAITGSLFSEENVDDSTSLNYYIVPDILDDIHCESSTAPSCRTFVFYAAATYKKAKTTESEERQKVAQLEGYTLRVRLLQMVVDR